MKFLYFFPFWPSNSDSWDLGVTVLEQNSIHFQNPTVWYERKSFDYVTVPSKNITTFGIQMYIPFPIWVLQSSNPMFFHKNISQAYSRKFWHQPNINIWKFCMVQKLFQMNLSYLFLEKNLKFSDRSIFHTLLSINT